MNGTRQGQGRPRPLSQGRPGWASMPLFDSGGDGARRDAQYGEHKVATFEELLEACVSMKVRFLVCEMGLRVLDIDRSDLRDDVPVEEGGIVTFLTDASSDGAVIFI